MTPIRIASLIAAAGALCACGTAPTQAPAFSQAGLPAAVHVPAGHRVAMETTGVGEITYECREKPAAAGQFEWAFVGPKAVLNDGKGRPVGRYYGPPATWEAQDGSKVTGMQLAVAPAAPGAIPYQLVKANPATGTGAMSGVSHIQRVATQGGVAPALLCDSAARGRQAVVSYQAGYIFYKAM